MDYYSAIKRNGILIMPPLEENETLSKRGQTQKYMLYDSIFRKLTTDRTIL